MCVLVEQTAVSIPNGSVDQQDDLTRPSCAPSTRRSCSSSAC